ncbi:MAG: hypothetical protein ABL879_02110 [Devosia sp.]
MRKGSRGKTRGADSARGANAVQRGHIPSGEGLEAAIASVFAEIQAEGIPEEDGEIGADNTFALLAELNRLWVSAPA